MWLGRIAIAGAILVLWPALAGAERVGLVVRAPTVAPATVGEVLDALAKAGSRAGHEIVRGPFAVARSALAAGAVHRRRLTAFARAQRLLDEGVRAYSAAELAFAAGRLANARRAALEVGDLPGGRELIAEISLYLGVVRLELGRGEAVDDLRLASRLAPARPVTTADFKPSLVSRYQQAAAPMTRRLSLRVRSLKQARIDVAAAGRRQSGAWSGQVEPGLHLVTVSAPGRRTQSRLLRVQVNQELDIDLDLDPARDAMARGRVSLSIPTTPRDASIAVRGLLTFAELDSLVIASPVWRRGQPALIGELCGGEPVSCQRAVEVRFRAGGLEAAARELWRRVALSGGDLPPGVLTDARVVRPDTAPGAGRPVVTRHWAKNPYLWVGVGAGVAVIVATTVLLAADDQRRPELVIGDDFLSP